MATPDAYAGTDDGLVGLSLGLDDAQIITQTLAGQSIRDVAVSSTSPSVVYAGSGLRGRGLYRIEAGRDAECLGLERRWVWGVTSTRDRLIIGTEPPAVFLSRDNGATLERLEGLDEVPSRQEWYFWYEPFEAGHIHGFAVHPTDRELILAAVEIGGVVRTADGGTSWTDGLRGRDCHDCLWDPVQPDRVYVGSHDGLFQSQNRGREFEPVDRFTDRYIRALATAGDRVLVSSAIDESASTATIHERHEGSWTQVMSVPTTGLGAAIAATKDTWLVGMADPDGQPAVRVSKDHGTSWTTVSVPDYVRSLAVP